MAKDFTEGHPFKVIFLFSLPMLIGNIFQQLYSTVDSIIVGNFVGKNALAAISGSGSVQFLLVAISFGFTAGISDVLSQVYGAKEYDKLKRAFSTSLIFVLSLALLLGIIGIAISTPLLKLLGTPDDIMPDAVAYLRIMFIGMPASFLYNMCSSALRSVGDSKTPLYFLVFSSILNIFLDLLFIVPFHMGVGGVAWATILSQFLSAILSLVVGLKNFPVLHLHREDFHDLKASAVLHLKTGFPMGFQMSVMCIGQLAMQAVVNGLGTAAVAGYTAASKADQLSVLVNNAMMTAISNYVAQNFGAGRKDRIRQGVRACLIQT